MGANQTLSFVAQAVSLHYVEISGSSDGWNVAYYVFTFFRGILFFTVIVLIGTGWSYMKVRGGGGVLCSHFGLVRGQQPTRGTAFCQHKCKPSACVCTCT